MEAASEAAAVLIIDGAVVGPAPWEGPLAPGTHIVQLIAGEKGSKLQRVTVNEGQIALARPQLQPLGPELQVKAHPRTAQVAIDGLVVGEGTWIGRLVTGAHEIEVSEDGYHTRKESFESRAGDPLATVSVDLEIDREHPRWPKPPTVSGDFWLGAFGGYAGSPSLGGDAGASCPDACSGSIAAHGGIVGLRAGYRFPIRLSLELGGGYAIFGSSFTRDVPSTFGANGQHALTYRIEDNVLVRGPFITVAASYRLSMNDWLSLEGRAAFGVVFAAASDDLNATATAGGTSAEIVVANRDLARAVTILVAPEIGAVADVGAVDLSLSLAVPIFPLVGPELTNGPIAPSGEPDPNNPGAATNVPASTMTSGEKAWDTFVMFSPQVGVGYDF